MPTAVADLVARFVAWARVRPDVRAAFFIGSQARTSHPADQWSDLDIVIVAVRPQDLLEQLRWLNEVGTPWLSFVEDTASGHRKELRVLFEGGVDVDFIPLSIDKFNEFKNGSIGPDLEDVIRRGVRFLIDKDRLGPIELVSTAPSPLPTQEELTEVVHDFWYHAVWTAKKLRRSELWSAKTCCDVHMKKLLLRMIEWHSKAIKGWDHDTWFRGRFLEEWADPVVRNRLKDAFATYETDAVRDALWKTMELFSFMTEVVFNRLGYPHPHSVEHGIREHIQALLPNRPI